MVSTTKTMKNSQIIEVRDARVSDADNIWDVFNLVVEEGVYLPVFSKVSSRYDRKSWFYELVNSGDFCLVAEFKKQDGLQKKFLGQVTVETSTEWDGMNHVGILGILVHPSYRDMGVGRALMEAASEEALHRGKKKIVLSVFHTNPRAIALYEKLGFEIVGRRKGQFLVKGEYIDEVLMEKVIAPLE